MHLLAVCFTAFAIDVFNLRMGVGIVEANLRLGTWQCAVPYERVVKEMIAWIRVSTIY